jgi:hypothetical protein
MCLLLLLIVYNERRCGTAVSRKGASQKKSSCFEWLPPLSLSFFLLKILPFEYQLLSLVSLRCDRSLRGCMGYLLIFANLTGGDITINASEKNEYR